MKKKTPKSPWDKARKLVLHRHSPCGIYTEPLERGVNYFVLMLEQLGATTEYSCEGHAHCPNNFYVVFNAPLCTAVKIQACGFFTVELEGDNRWSIRTRIIPDDKTRRQVLRWAAAQWERHLGPLEAIAGDMEKTACHV